MSNLIDKNAVEGSLTLLGTSHGVSGGRQYSTIEIGGKLLKNIIVTSALESFLNRAVEQNGNTTLYIVKGYIYGVKLPDGRLYYSILSMAWPYYILFCSIIGSFLILGLLLLPSAIKIIIINRAINNNAKKLSLIEGAIAT